MPDGVIRQVKRGARNLPVNFWPIVFEKIVPVYGDSYIEINDRLFGKDNPVSKKVTKHRHKGTDSHDRLNTVK